MELQSASIDFKTQVQEWKNILIRGNNEEDFKKYEKAFFDKESVVRDRLRKSLESLKKDNDPESAQVILALESLIKAHAELGTAYKGALSNFDNADPETGKKVDRA